MPDRSHLFLNNPVLQTGRETLAPKRYNFPRP